MFLLTYIPLTLSVKNSNCKLTHNIISKNLFNIQIVGGEIGSFGVCFCVGLCGGQQTGLVGVELQRNGQPSFCRPKVSLEVKRLVVLLSAWWLHCRLLGLLVKGYYLNFLLYYTHLGFYMIVPVAYLLFLNKYCNYIFQIIKYPTNTDNGGLLGSIFGSNKNRTRTLSDGSILWVIFLFCSCLSGLYLKTKCRYFYLHM